MSFVLSYRDLISRLSIFIVYFWFGFIKITGQSPASELVMALQRQTLPFFDPKTFVILLGVVEVVIAVMYLIRPITKYAFLTSILHMGTTFLPLIVLPAIAWQSALIPTLEAQYILKNLILVALMIEIYGHYAKNNNR